MPLYLYTQGYTSLKTSKGQPAHTLFMEGFGQKTNSPIGCVLTVCLGRVLSLLPLLLWSLSLHDVEPKEEGGRGRGSMMGPCRAVLDQNSVTRLASALVLMKPFWEFECDYGIHICIQQLSLCVLSFLYYYFFFSFWKECSFDK